MRNFATAVTKLNSKTTMLGLAAAGLMFGTATSAGEPDPYRMADDTWINISGTVESVSRNTFMLDYGEGLVIVEMDDGDRDADAYKLLTGDRVTVSGRVDDDLFEATTIEAASVYVENIGTTFFASSIDEETAESLIAGITIPVAVSHVTVRGTVTEVGDHEFTVDAGGSDMRVEVGQMPYNPLDDEGYQQIRVGDRVKVSGEMDSGLFEGRELVAESVITLNSLPSS